ncbi:MULTISPECIES: NupC/NupG family nucleoside CNT transporter [Chromohalobacter]|jgi:CNT family concentrative nucleoside transporter|uniref:NupC/NupG family nucleoside CNT transporter n=1 Tax=Chromohalobacter TaxID=42054 RepID=UPI000D7174F1|nr:MULTISPECIES: NupC/NupG family nucleoside CNT transporter [Chromohalobacter]MBZ5876412.1 NupC/NupG family nucleoside CNT transporter [Chromohalobacter salexigens]MDO0945388.1 NupC/NupG family nucleoside CNT transporter [Chromohalobacter salexigens]NQY45493.1 NupC/NupG family nucleoside CNT transporter [Chromohalobacter sp.]PWW42896.1 CNT family concentrative nucleoside transporter [Chromohalobacter salexigens]RXE46670.1 NupC/NupG family nucleoside CNT transporter [Chromohalobacter salexigen
MTTIMSLVGMATLILIAVLFSSDRKSIRLRTVGGAFAIQAAIGAFVLYIPFGQAVLATLSEGVSQVIVYADDGINFLFGDLANPESVGFVFAFKVLPVIIFFSSLIAVLYHLKIMQWIIRLLGGALQRVLGTSRTESMSATANIFVGQTEAPLVVRPFIASMTRSELFAVMCGGLASVAGSVLAGYASLGIPMEYLIAASFMAAPGGLLFAKLLMPETEKPDDSISRAEEKIEEDEKPANVLDAAATGATSGMMLAANVGAMLLAFIGLIALLNGILGGVGGWFGMESLSLEMILGWLFAPLAFLLGIPWSEATLAGSFIGQKIVVNEFVAFINLAPYISGDTVVAATGEAMSKHTAAVLSFALCGFANLSSIAILLGGLGLMAPNRRQEIARYGLKAVLAGTLSNLMSATIAGLFISLA